MPSQVAVADPGLIQRNLQELGDAAADGLFFTTNVEVRLWKQSQLALGLPTLRPATLATE